MWISTFLPFEGAEQVLPKLTLINTICCFHPKCRITVVRWQGGSIFQDFPPSNSTLQQHSHLTSPSRTHWRYKWVEQETLVSFFNVFFKAAIVLGLDNRDIGSSIGFLETEVVGRFRVAILWIRVNKTTFCQLECSCSGWTFVRKILSGPISGLVKVRIRWFLFKWNRDLDTE